MTATPTAPDASDLFASELYFNRELSWLCFNERVLALSEDPDVPLLERLKFAAIYGSNLDEFFMIRVAGVHDQVEAGLTKAGSDGRTPSAVLAAIHERTRALGERHARCVRDELCPELAEQGIRIADCEEVSTAEREMLSEHFRREIFPVLTPLAVGLGRPFPYISNLSLSLAVLLRDPASGQRTFARVKVPKEVVPRFVALGESTTFVPLEQVIAANLEALFPGVELLAHGVFRVTRDADLDISDEAIDLREAVESQLRRRRLGGIVRVEVEAGMDPELRERIVEALRVDAAQVDDVDGLLDATDLLQIEGLPGYAELRFPAWVPVTQPRLQGDPPDVLGAMRHGDVLVHHPYDSFETSVERFVEQAVADPDVLAIKLTIYRTSDDSPLVPALIRAAEQGKQAVCLVELKARFDEQRNLRWARSLEQAGVHVVYGNPALKTHAKTILVVRREGDGVRRYVHLGTGNYHPNTARVYTDFGLFTCDEGIAEDVTQVFNELTGYARDVQHRRLILAPAEARDAIVREIEETVRVHEAGGHARIALKMNSLVDRPCIRALYRASQAGVPIELCIRGICRLRPGVPGVSETITVVSVVGRFLEHSRIFAFERDGETRVLIGSADLMPRNLDNRVELLAPVDDPEARAEVLDVLERSLADEVNCWTLDADGEWTRRSPSEPPRSVHRELMARNAARASEAAKA